MPESRDSHSTSDEEATTAEGLWGTLGSAAVDPGTREALAELGQRARSVVDELARQVRRRREGEGASASRESAASAASGAATPDPAAATGLAADLHQRLHEVRACIDEFADVLEGTVERLESIEGQLGDPDATVERLLGEGIGRCEGVLLGIERRVTIEAARRAASAGQGDPGPGTSDVVLVVASSSRRRAGLCLALERQGLAAVAAPDLSLALRQAALHGPSLALLLLEGTREEREALLDEWKDHHDRGSLPPAAVLEEAGLQLRREDFPGIRESHGGAAMAASLQRLVQQAREAAGAAEGQGAGNE